MKNWMFALLMIIVFSSTILILQISDGKILGPKMPTNSEELSNWSADDLWKLENSLKCNDVPGYKNNEPDEFAYWRNICKIVEDYWVKAYRKEKVENGMEIFKKLDLPR